MNCGRSLCCGLEESGFVLAAAVMLSSLEKIHKGKMKVREKQKMKVCIISVG